MKQKIFSILALLCMAVSGAWAADTYTITASALTNTANISTEAELPYETTLAACYEAATGSAPNAMLTVTAASVTNGTNVTVGTVNGWNTPLTVTAAGESVLNVTLNYGSANITITATKNASTDPGTSDVTVTPTANKNEWTFTMPGYDVEVGVVYDTELALNEADDNAATLEEWNGYEADVTLTRTLQTGGWNTLALPFNVESATLTAINAKLALMSGSMTVKELTGSSFENGTLTLNFGDATSIKAGTPYLVKVTKALNFATLAAFKDAEVSKTLVPTETTAVDFIPTLGLTEISGDANNILFLSSGNTLLHPSSLPANMKGFRAYFLLKGNAALARSFSMDFGDGETTGIQTIENGQVNSESVYDLQGRRVNGSVQKGVYIVNGKKTVIK